MFEKFELTVKKGKILWAYAQKMIEELGGNKIIKLHFPHCSSFLEIA